MTEEGALIKLQNQLAKATKLADVFMSKEVKGKAAFLALMDETQWGYLCRLAGVTPASEETRTLTMFLVKDREQQAKLRKK